MFKAIIFACLVLYLLFNFEHIRSIRLGDRYSFSSEALFFVSTVQSQAEWQNSEYHFKKELLSSDRGCGKVIIVDSLKDFIGRSFPGCEQNPEWGGFVVYSQMKLARFNFPFSGKDIFSEKIHWAKLNIWAYNFFHPPEKYFPLSDIMAVYGLSAMVDSLEDLESKINDPDTDARGKRNLFRFLPRRSVASNSPMTTTTSIGDLGEAQ